MSKQVVSQVKKTKSGNATWILKNWKDCHDHLTSSSDCIVDVDDMKFRFFLRPFVKTFTVDDVLYSEKWYSLYVELVSDHEKVLLGVDTAVDFCYNTTYGFLAMGRSQADSKITVDKTATCGKDGAQIVTKQLIRMNGWTTTADTSGIQDTPIQPGKKYMDQYKDTAEEIRLKLIVNVFSLGNVSKPEATEEKGVVSVDVQKLSIQFGQLLGPGFDEKLSDVKFVLSDKETLYAHKIILASGSPVFRTMFMSEMRESHTGLVEISDINSKTMKLILQYIYTGKIDSVSCEENIEEVVYAASKYQLPGLLEYCDRNMISFCKPKNAVALLRLTKLHGLSKAQKNLKIFIEANPAKILLEMA